MLTDIITFADPAMVFIFEEFLEDEELGVRRVPDGLSEFSWTHNNENLNLNLNFN